MIRALFSTFLTQIFHFFGKRRPGARSRSRYFVYSSALAVKEPFAASTVKWPP